ncbi:MAG: thiamine phosphate synthase [Chakrabartia sp.]
MRKRHSPPLPTLWLMTDERMGNGLLPSVAALPKGSGIIFRHYSLPAKARRALFVQVQRIAKRQRHILILAGDSKTARAWKADGAHGKYCADKRMLQTRAVHSIRERITAERAGADLMLVSPLFVTASHRGAKGIGRIGFGFMARNAKTRVIALGGMTAHRARSLKNFGIYGWAAIDALAVDIRT